MDFKLWNFEKDETISSLRACMKQGEDIRGFGLGMVCLKPFCSEVRYTWPLLSGGPYSRLEFFPCEQDHRIITDVLFTFGNYTGYICQKLTGNDLAVALRAWEKLELSGEIDRAYKEYKYKEAKNVR